MSRFGVAGWPVAHSRSPQIHHAAYAALGLTDRRYQRLPIPPDLFEETVRSLPELGFRGINVTIPHKERALALSGTVSDEARAIGAVNTLTFEDGVVEGMNTDAPGFLAAVGEIPRSALVLGAGGSARAIVWALEQHGCDVAVLARTPRDIGGRNVSQPVEADMLVNCTPVGLDDPDASPLDASGYGVVVDLVYRPGGTRLLKMADSMGAKTVDGLEILVRQGALSFERWTGQAAPLDAMRRAAQG